MTQIYHPRTALYELSHHNRTHAQTRYHLAEVRTADTQVSTRYTVSLRHLLLMLVACTAVLSWTLLFSGAARAQGSTAHEIAQSATSRTQAAQAEYGPDYIHVVQPGETLREIAESYGTTWQTVAALNRMTNPNALEVGQGLRVFGAIPADYIADYAEADYSLAEYGTVAAMPASTVTETATMTDTAIVDTATSTDTITTDTITTNTITAATTTTSTTEGQANMPASTNSNNTGSDDNMPASTGSNNTGSNNNVPVLSGNYAATDNTHTVQPGDTLGQIAAQYGVPLSALVEVNNLANPSLIHVGQQIVIAGPAIPPAPEAPNAEGKVILISISDQYIWAYEDGEVYVESFVTTGRPRADTRPGTFEVLVKYTDYRFISPYPEGHEFYYNSQVSNYSLRYTWDGFHIHDSPWRSDYGPGTNVPHVDSLGRQQAGSIGCVNVTAGAMERLFEWAEVGTPIVIVE